MAFPEELVRYKGAQLCPVCGEQFEMKVMSTPAGFFVGTECCEGPNSRESDYYPSSAAVLAALAARTVAWRKLGYQGGA